GVRAVQLANGTITEARAEPPSAVARVTRVLRMIENDLGAKLTLDSSAMAAWKASAVGARTAGASPGRSPRAP
ncbi:MAG TPA: hypothetical protein VK579_03445, partial [Terriglobales bacterium]|nr:hypothetical protein [Terriglobales bacterium]